MKGSLALSLLCCCGLLIALPLHAEKRAENGSVTENSVLPVQPKRNKFTAADQPRADEPVDDLPEDAIASSANREPTLSKAEAARRARQEYGGRVLAVRWTGRHYQVKLLREGEVRTVFIVD